VRIAGPTDPHIAALQRLLLAASPKPAGQLVEPVPPPAPAAAQAQAQAQSQTSVAMLLAIAASDPQAQRRRNVTDAANGLKGLERLHKQLRIGAPGAASLAEIRAWVNDHGVPDDPQAAALLREVEMRVLVELAKAEREA
jgi:hypothetical protein